MTGNGANTIDGLAFDAGTGTYCARYSTPPSEAVVSIIATILDEPPLELDPLSEVVDSDALNRLLLEAASTQRTGARRVNFSYCGHEVTVHSYGIVEVKPIEDGNGRIRRDSP